MLRYYLALWIAKLSIIALKITHHNGTNFPGVVAFKICPNFLKYAKKPSKIIGVTGTNGKTTVTNMLIDMLKANGQIILDNNKGSNTVTGIITSIVIGSTIFGKMKYDTAVFEIDERSTRLIFQYLNPNYLIVNNLTRDSIMRNGHPEFISKIITKYMPESTKLILNGDDLIAATVAPNNERVYFGIDRLEGDVTECINLINDMQICPKCNTVLKYEYLRYHHIGKAYCPNCDFKSPAVDYLGCNVDTDNMTIYIVNKGNSHTYRLLNDSVFNIYNVVAVVACFKELGYKDADIESLLEHIEIVKSRYEVVQVGKYRIIKQMSKDRNALGSSRAFDYIAGLDGNKELILMMNNLSDNNTWSENVCWLYDCDFEFLNKDNIKNIICTGPRAKDYFLRLKYAGVDDSVISIVGDELSAPDKLKLVDAEDVYVLFGTDSIELADKVVEKSKKVMLERGNI